MKHWRWILTLLFGLLVALASAQTFQRSLPFLAKPLSTGPHTPVPPNLIPNIYCWWVNTNLTVGANVSNWTDVVSGYIARNGSAATPTNATGGVYFDNFNSVVGITFTNLPMNLGSTYAISIILGVDANTGLFQGIVNDSGSGRDLEYLNAPSPRLSWQVDSTWTTLSTISLDTVYDVTVIRNYTNNYFYVDGVFTAQKTEATTGDFTLILLSASSNVRGFWGWVSDLCLFTNVTTTNNFIATDMHWWRTNQSRGTPHP